MADTLREHLARAGAIRSKRKAIAARKNGVKGGRPITCACGECAKCKRRAKKA